MGSIRITLYVSPTAGSLVQGQCSDRLTPCAESSEFPPIEMHTAGSLPNFVLNVSDLQRTKFGFQGQEWTDTPDQLDPADCP